MVIILWFTNFCLILMMLFSGNVLIRKIFISKVSRIFRIFNLKGPDWQGQSHMNYFLLIDDCWQFELSSLGSPAVYEFIDMVIDEVEGTNIVLGLISAIWDNIQRQYLANPRHTPRNFSCLYLTDPRYIWKVSGRYLKCSKYKLLFRRAMVSGSVEFVGYIYFSFYISINIRLVVNLFVPYSCVYFF